jgi:hypothetical protein
MLRVSRRHHDGNSGIFFWIIATVCFFRWHCKICVNWRRTRVFINTVSKISLKNTGVPERFSIVVLFSCETDLMHKKSVWHTLIWEPTLILRVVDVISVYNEHHWYNTWESILLSSSKGVHNVYLRKKICSE